MTATHVLAADDGYGWHFESGLRFVTLCGRVLEDEDDVAREPYEGAPTPEHRHASLCFDCLTVANGGAIGDERRAIHFDGGRA